MEICEWLIGVEYDVYHYVLYFSPYLNCENFMKLLNYYGDVVGDYMCISAYMLLVNFLTCYWWIFLHELWEFYGIVELLWWCFWWLYVYKCIYVVGEFSYMLLAMTWWCKHILKYVGVDCWSYVNICIVVVGSYVHAFISMLVTNTLYSIIGDDYDVFVASWGDNLGVDLVPHASRGV